MPERVAAKYHPDVLTLRPFVGYEADVPVTAYIELTAVGDPVSDVQLFLAPGQHVTCPLAAAHETACAHFPGAWKELVKLPTNPPEPET